MQSANQRKRRAEETTNMLKRTGEAILILVAVVVLFEGFQLIDNIHSDLKTYSSLEAE